MPLSGLTTSLVNIIRENNILFLKTNWPFDKNLDRADKQRCHWLEVKVFPKKKIIWEACIKDYTCHQNLITLPIHTLPIRYKLVILTEHFYLLLCLMNAINLHEPKILLNKSVGFYCFVVFFLLAPSSEHTVFTTCNHPFFFLLAAWKKRHYLGILTYEPKLHVKFSPVFQSCFKSLTWKLPFVSISWSRNTSNL